VRSEIVRICVLTGLVACAAASVAQANAWPWTNASLSPDERASMAVAHMTESEELSLVRGWLGIRYNPGNPPPFTGNKRFHDVVGSSGYVPGIPRLGIPPLQETDASVGVANLGGMMRPGDVATALPSSLLLGASFDVRAAYQCGAMIAQEAWHKGLNVLLGPGMDLIRDPRNGRNFEYISEDPLLTGELAASFIRGVQSQHVIAVAKHYAMNDQETDRNSANALIGEAAMRESDLLGFELAIEGGHPGAIMCSYNLVNGTYACEDRHLLEGVLKGDWHYPGFVMSDWGAVHGLDAATAGLDQESAAMLDAKPYSAAPAPYFAAPLREAIQDGTVPRSRLTDMARRILRSMFAVGLIVHPPMKSPIDYQADGEVALREAQAGIVLLKNDRNVLPLGPESVRIAVIGGHADSGVLSGGGSSQVFPAGGPGISIPFGGANPVLARLNVMIFDPSPPLKAISALAPKAQVRFDSGDYPSQAAKLAKWADVAIVFATQWTSEGRDVPDLSLPNGQDELIRAVAAANPKTVVVLETGGPVDMPWLSQVAAVVESWYPGQRGGEAIADILYGKVNPSGHLPVTFPASISQNPRPVIPGSGAVDVGETMGLGPQAHEVDVHYSEGAAVGYRWFAARHLVPLFPFGHGLSYTTFDYSSLRVTAGRVLTVSFDVKNTGSRAGSAVPQVYLVSRAGQRLERLIGFSRVSLAAGESRHVSLQIDPRLLADFDAGANGWRMPAGRYTVALARSVTDEVLTGSARVDGEVLPP